MTPICLGLLGDEAGSQFCAILGLDAIFGFGICGD